MIPNPSEIKRILITKPSSLGDIIHALPAMGELKGYFSNASITWLVASDFADILPSRPLIDSVIPVNMSGWKKPSQIGRTLNELKSLKKQLKGADFDLVIDLQGLLRSGLIGWFTCARYRIGFADAREMAPLFYTHNVSVPAQMHAVDRNLALVRALGCPARPVEFPIPTAPCPLPFTDYCVLVPGARWDTKLWPSERFGELASRLKLPSVVVGSAADTSRAELIVKLSGGKAISLAGRTSLRELAGVIKAARFMVTNDSGPMHIAAGLGVPVFAIFGPTNPALTGPYGAGHTVISANADCAPCRRKRCRSSKCILDVTVDMVAGAVEARGISP